MGGLNTKEEVRSEDEGRRAFICHSNGIVMGNLLFKCAFCKGATDSVIKLRRHYERWHADSSQIRSEYLNEPSFIIHNSDLSVRCRTDGPDGLSSLPLSTAQSIIDIDEENLWIKDDKRDNLSTIECLTDGNNNSISKTNGQIRMSPFKKSPSRGGEHGMASISCGVCKTDRYFACVQSHHGQHICVFCYRFFRKFLLNPVIYSCPTLGKCPLTVKNKCEACLIESCLRIYSGSILDSKVEKILENYRPLKNDSKSLSSTPNNVKKSTLDMTNHHREENQSYMLY